MNNSLFKDVIGWGIGLWFIGYVLGFVFFPLLPLSLIGWAITPIGVVITLWVLFKRITSTSFQRYLLIAFGWTLIAIVCDYLFLVLLLNPENYYKPAVFLYYALTFTLPLIVGWYKSKN